MVRIITNFEKKDLTPEQIAQMEQVSAKPMIYDEDCPELTSAMEKAFRLAAQTCDRLKKRAPSDAV